MRREAGFTLIELLVTVSIVGIISTALTEAVMITLRTADATEHRLVESSGASLLSTYLVPDTQSAASVTTTPGANCANGNAIVSLSWTDPSTPPVTKSASYACSAGRLIRTQTIGGVSSQQTLATDVAGTPTVVCVPTLCAPLPLTVQLAVATCTSDITPCPAAETYAYDVTASTRALP